MKRIGIRRRKTSAAHAHTHTRRHTHTQAPTTHTQTHGTYTRKRARTRARTSARPSAHARTHARAPRPPHGPLSVQTSWRIPSLSCGMVALPEISARWTRSAPGVGILSDRGRRTCTTTSPETALSPGRIYGVSMVCPWCVRGVSMVCPWCVDGRSRFFSKVHNSFSFFSEVHNAFSTFQPGPAVRLGLTNRNAS